MARLPLIALALGWSGGAPISAQSVASSPPRWPEALHAADELTDEGARSRARVEVLYAAGDLPGALQESLNALRAHPKDGVLLRRACQLALALRIVEAADSSARTLAAALPDLTSDENTARWWRDESARLSAEARELHARGQELDDAVRRARLVSAALLASIALAWIGCVRAR